MYSCRFMRFDVSNHPAFSSLGINFEDCCSSLRKSWRRRSSSRCSGAFPTWIRRNSIANCGLVVWVGSIHAMAKFYGTSGLWSSYNIIPYHELGNSWNVGERVPKWEVAGGKGSGLRWYMDLKTTLGWSDKGWALLEWNRSSRPVATRILYSYASDPRVAHGFITDTPQQVPMVLAPRNPFAQMDPSCLPELPTVRALGTQNSNPKLHRGAVPVASAIKI